MPPPLRKVEYKIVEQKHKTMLGGHMRASDLEAKLNEYAAQGWVLDRITSGETAGFIGGKDVFLIIFRREVGA